MAYKILVLKGDGIGPEVVGEAGPTLDPDRPAEWREALVALADGAVYRRQAERSLKEADRFTIERTRKAIISAYECALP